MAQRTTRRVIAGNTPTGSATVLSDEALPIVSRGLGHGMTGTDIWSTDTMPIDSSAAGLSAQKAGLIHKYNQFNYVGSGQGSAFRITHWEPGHAMFTHRTQTVDYDVVLEGEIDLELEGDDGEKEVVHLKQGDTVVLRQCRHTWINRSEKPALTVFVLLDAEPFKTEKGEVLEPEFPGVSS